MRKWVLAVVVTLGAALALPATSFAATTVEVNASFTEGIAKQFGCTVQQPGNCGPGKVLPFGSATETIQFGAACGGTCDLRTITLPQGTLVLDETDISFSCPGACNSHGVGKPGMVTLSDVVDGVGSSGIFSGASGTLSGSVKGGGGAIQILLSGSITLVP